MVQPYFPGAVEPSGNVIASSRQKGKEPVIWPIEPSRGLPVSYGIGGVHPKLDPDDLKGKKLKTGYRTTHGEYKMPLSIGDIYDELVTPKTNNLHAGELDRRSLTILYVLS